MQNQTTLEENGRKYHHKGSSSRYASVSISLVSIIGYVSLFKLYWFNQCKCSLGFKSYMDVEIEQLTIHKRYYGYKSHLRIHECRP